MNKYTTLLIALFISFQIQAQNISRDFLGNLTYESARDNYKAKLEKNVFNDLIFTDNKNNKITFNNNFLSRTSPTVLSNFRDQETFFEHHLNYLRKLSNRKEEFVIDMFDTWKFETNENNYKAELKKDIFNAWIFSDNKGNQSSYDEKYLSKIPNHPFRTSKEQYTFFVNLMDRFSTEKNYRVDFKVDIFNKVIVSDNRGFKRESTEAYYLLPNFQIAEDTVLNDAIHIRKINNGEFAYRDSNEYARIFESRMKRWTYEDSSGNRFQISPSTWNKMMQLYKSEDEILRHLIFQYLM